MATNQTNDASGTASHVSSQSTSGAKFSATIEFLRGQRAAIVELHTLAGEWAGAQRIECRTGRRSDLYELGYNAACASAHFKGGRVETFRECGQPEPLPATCASRVEFTTPRRPANALNIEIGTPLPRCLNKRPSHWPTSMSALRWRASGGNALVFGICSGICPLKAAR